MTTDLFLGMSRLTLLAYSLAMAGYIASLLSQRVRYARYATAVFLAAFACHTILFFLRWHLSGQSPFLTVPDVASLFAWAAAAVYLALQLRTKTRVLGALVSPVAVFFFLGAMAGWNGPAEAPGILRSGFVTAHIVLTVLGEALFAVAALSGVMSLLQDSLIRRRRSGGMMDYFPSLADLDRINGTCLLWGFPLLTLGILSGAAWARTAWGTPWLADPKFLWVMLAWVVYAAVLHQRLALGWKGRRAAVITVIAMMFLSLAYWAQQAFFVTVHRFV